MSARLSRRRPGLPPQLIDKSVYCGRIIGLCDMRYFLPSRVAQYLRPAAREPERNAHKLQSLTKWYHCIQPKPKIHNRERSPAFAIVDFGLELDAVILHFVSN